jgi:ADP-ribose pyrophosphatase YjhB (NUDIX family)
LDSACVDIVIATTDKKGEPRVLAIKRGPNKPFANKWWMQGGALHAYVSTLDFVTERAEKECGVRPQIVGLICVARTCAPDFLASTTQPCYLGLVPFEKICVKYDADHSAGRLLGWNDLSHLPTDEQHWYPMFAFKTAINALT